MRADQRNKIGQYVRASLWMGCLCFCLSYSANAGEVIGDSEGSPWSVEGFIGGTDTESNIEPTIGLALAYKINRDWTIGALVEGSNREEGSTLYMGELVWHPFESLHFLVGLGKKDPSGEHETTYRAGISYEIGLEEGWFVKPFTGMDFIENEGDELVFGIYFVKEL
jgi:hypothetical protein